LRRSFRSPLHDCVTNADGPSDPTPRRDGWGLDGDTGRTAELSSNLRTTDVRILNVERPEPIISLVIEINVVLRNLKPPFTFATPSSAPTCLYSKRRQVIISAQRPVQLFPAVTPSMGRDRKLSPSVRVCVRRKVCDAHLVNDDAADTNYLLSYTPLSLNRLKYERGAGDER
jgi:hypothetical protein